MLELMDLILFGWFIPEYSAKAMDMGVWSQVKSSVPFWEAGSQINVGGTAGGSLINSGACGKG